MANQESWKPHLRLANVRKVLKLRTEAKRLHPSLTSDFKNTRFEGKLVQEIQFCSINGPKSRKNYYEVISEIRIGQKKTKLI